MKDSIKLISLVALLAIGSVHAMDQDHPEVRAAGSNCGRMRAAANSVCHERDRLKVELTEAVQERDAAVSAADAACLLAARTIEDLTSQHTQVVAGKDAELSALAQTLAARDTRIAELEAALAVERRVNEENARSQAIIRDLITHSQGARSRAPSADPGRRPQVAPAATVATSPAASTVAAPGAPQ